MNNRRWFHANVPDMEAAEDLLRRKGFDGSFLVRHSKGHKGGFSLAARRGDKVVHVRIKHEEDGYAVEGGETFATLSELIETYSNGTDTLTETNGQVINLRQPLNCVDPTNERWYHGHIDRMTAEKLLMNSGNADAFLVRESRTQPGNYVISIRGEENAITNVIVDYKENRYSVPGEGEYPFFDTIAELVEYYRYQGLVCTNGTQLRLSKPVNTTRVNVAAISDRFTALQSEKDRSQYGRAGFFEEFECLQKQEGQNLLDREEGRKPECISKNRYKNILPFDSTRVVLTDGDPNIPGSDYINANYIKMESGSDSCSYIATQGCLQNTVVDMWRMIWQENATIIVMLTKLMERSKNKCTRYWPDEFEDHKVHFMYHSQLNVTFKRLTKMTDYEITELELKRRDEVDGEWVDAESRTVFHFHFTTWPDKSVPKDPGPLLDFVRAVTDRRKELSRVADIGPLVVHCSAGIGRTGAFIVIDALLRQINELGLECDIDIQRMVQEARQQRSGMVQTEEQYRFIYEVIRHYIETQKKRMIEQHLSTEEMPQEYSNMYVTKNGLKQAVSAPLPGMASAKNKHGPEPVYENASAKAVPPPNKEVPDPNSSAYPVYENARSRKRR